VTEIMVVHFSLWGSSVTHPRSCDQLSKRGITDNRQLLTADRNSEMQHNPLRPTRFTP